MSNIHPHKQLQALRKQLDQQSFTNHEAKEKASKLSDMIDKSIALNSPEKADYNELKSHLKDSMLHFEVSHPTLTTTISNIINTLNMMGI